MPSRPVRLCTQPGGCADVAVDGSRCRRHQKVRRQAQRQHYSGVAGVNYGRRWGKARAVYLSKHPFCVQCPAESLSEATQLDHIVPHRNDYTLFWDESNWQGLCDSHHSAKTAREVELGRHDR